VRKISVLLDETFEGVRPWMCFSHLTKPLPIFFRSACEMGLLHQYPLAFTSQELQLQLFVVESPLLENQAFVWGKDEEERFGLSLGRENNFTL